MFDTEKNTKGLEGSTFDVLQVDAFYNTRPWTILSYMWVWILLMLKLAILGGDTYTCISLLAFNRWSSLEYTVYEYKIAKWIFTGCILFRIVLLVYQISWAIHVFRTRNIALAYLNNYARMMYAIRSYKYQCLFHQIDLEGFFEWACFFVYSQLDDALETLVADLPRQVINFMTLRFYATGGDRNNAILTNIQVIAETNVRLAVVLSIQLASLAIFLFFFFQFVFAMILFIPIKVKVSHKGFRLLKDICYFYVNNNVRYLVKKNHKSKKQLVAEGIMDYDEIRQNPLLASESTLDFNNLSNPFARTYSGLDLSNASFAMSDMSSKGGEKDYQRLPPPRTYTASSLRHEVSSQAAEDNPFVDPSNLSSRRSASDLTEMLAFPPASVRPPPRTQTMESVGSYQYNRTFSENSVYMNNQPSMERLVNDEERVHPHRTVSDDLASIPASTYSSRTAARRPPPIPFVSELAPMSRRESHDDHTQTSTLIDSDKSGSDLENDQVGSPYPVTEDIADTTPYPVRGVSQYFPQGYTGRLSQS